jgi:ABC-type multidrug transport system fused ATPase/permease subunit
LAIGVFDCQKRGARRTHFSAGGAMPRIPTDDSPPRGIWLRWEALTYDVALPRDAAGAKRILHGLSGQLLPAQLMAVMGPSGSGKTSLMKLLAGRRPPTAGALLVNGEPMDVPTLRRASGFVAQTTVFLDTLTVRETVTFTAVLRLDRSVPLAAKRARVEEVRSSRRWQRSGCARLTLHSFAGSASRRSRQVRRQPHRQRPDGRHQRR